MSLDITRTTEIAIGMSKRRPFMLDLVKRLFREKPLGAFGLVVVLILLFAGIFADQLAPYAMNEIHLSDRLLPVFSPGYFLGTDHLGRDLLSNIIYGARISVIIGLSATALQQVIGITIGGTSALIMGKYDLIVQRIVDAVNSIPPLLILLTVMGIVGQGMIQIILVLGITGGIRDARINRSAVIALREHTYVQASDVIGCSFLRKFIKHIIPNIMYIVIIGFSIGIGGNIMQEATLSFLGFGVPPGVPSWGAMISQEGREYIELAPQLAIWPGLALGLVIYSCNMLGDELRDLLDPRLRGGLGRYTISKKRLEKIKARVGI